MKFRMKLKSLARKREKLSARPIAVDAPSYPHVDFDSKEMPEVADLKFGDTVHLHLHGVVDSRSMSDYDGKPTHRAGIKLLKGSLQNAETPANTTEAVDGASRMAGGTGRIIKGFTEMSGMKG